MSDINQNFFDEKYNKMTDRKFTTRNNTKSK